MQPSNLLVSQRRPQRPLIQSRHTSRTRRESLRTAHPRALHRQRLAHNGASTGENLQVGHGAAAGATTGAGTGGRSERAQSGGRGALEEWAHGPRLVEEGLHINCSRLINQLFDQVYAEERRE